MSIAIGGLAIESHGPEWAFGWDERDNIPVRIPAADEAEARVLAHRAGGEVFVREVFESAWVAAL